jgi:hypothetical protein
MDQKYKINLLIITTLAIVVFFPKISKAATLYISPSSGSYTAGQNFTVSVLTNSQNVAVNTAEANITYSTDTLELVSVKQGTTFFLSAPGSPTKGSGTAYIGGGLPTPGYTGSGGLVGTLTFTAKAQGTGTINIANGKVLLNDGFGTNALTTSSGSKFTIGPPAVGGVQVSSTTHPDSNNWYNKKQIDLSWARPNGAYGFSFEFNQSPNTVPDNELDTTVTTTKSYADVKDGIWYFHIKARRQDAGSFGGTTHFKISIDSVVPHNFDLKLVGEDQNELTTSTPTISFETKDDLSGIERYGILLDDDVYKESVTSPFTFDQISGGNRKITVVAYDKAGNQTQSEINIKVTGSSSFITLLKKTVEVPMYFILIFNILFLIFLAAFVFVFLKKKELRMATDPDIRQIQEEIDDSLENLKIQISQKLLGISAKSSEELFEKETAAAKDLRAGIVKTRKSIDKKISRIKKKPIVKEEFNEK